MNKRDVVHAEIREVLRTTTDLGLRKDALFMGTCLRFMEPIAGPAAVSMAESFARQAPEDKRAGELLYSAATKLDSEWYTLLGLAAILTLSIALTAVTIGMGRWLKFLIRLVEVLLVLFVLILCGFAFLANDTLTAFIQGVCEKPSVGSAVAMVMSWLFTVLGVLPDTLGEAEKHQRTLFVAAFVLNEGFQQIRILAWTAQGIFALALAVLSAVFLVIGPPGGSLKNPCGSHPRSGWTPGVSHSPGGDVRCRCVPGRVPGNADPRADREVLSRLVPGPTGSGDAGSPAHRRAVRAGVQRRDLGPPSLYEGPAREGRGRGFLGDVVRSLCRGDS